MCQRRDIPVITAIRRLAAEQLPEGRGFCQKHYTEALHDVGQQQSEAYRNENGSIKKRPCPSLMAVSRTGPVRGSFAVAAKDFTIKDRPGKPG